MKTNWNESPPTFNLFKLSGDLVFSNKKHIHVPFDTMCYCQNPKMSTINGQNEYDFKFNGKLNYKVLPVETNGKVSIHQFLLT